MNFATRWEYNKESVVLLPDLLTEAPTHFQITSVGH